MPTSLLLDDDDDYSLAGVLEDAMDLAQSKISEQAGSWRQSLKKIFSKFWKCPADALEYILENDLYLLMFPLLTVENLVPTTFKKSIAK
jgi:hypothetical protein